LDEKKKKTRPRMAQPPPSLHVQVAVGKEEGKKNEDDDD